MRALRAIARTALRAEIYVLCIALVYVRRCLFMNDNNNINFYDYALGILFILFFFIVFCLH